jgi:hypothetical protein
MWSAFLDAYGTFWVEPGEGTADEIRGIEALLGR